MSGGFSVGAKIKPLNYRDKVCSSSFGLKSNCFSEKDIIYSEKDIFIQKKIFAERYNLVTKARSPGSIFHPLVWDCLKTPQRKIKEHKEIRWRSKKKTSETRFFF